MKIWMIWGKSTIFGNIQSMGSFYLQIVMFFSWQVVVSSGFSMIFFSQPSVQQVAPSGLSPPLLHQLSWKTAPFPMDRNKIRCHLG